MNRTRASSLDAFGTRDQRNRIYPTLEASDGSTLSLDFTQMSSLDSRFTFTRASTGTYINSQGYVAFANHNLAINSTWTDANATPTGWTVYNGSTPNAVISIPETGKRSITVSSGVQSFMYQAQTINPGIANTLSIVVHSVTGTGPTISNLLAINAAVAPPDSGSILYYKDGVSVSSTTAVTPGSWSMVFSGGNQIRLLQGSSVATSTYTIVISSPQLQQGFVPLPAIVNNTSTASAYQAPRFDYNPTTLTPSGLLIEGSATNLGYSSEGFSTTYWGISGLNGGVPTSTSQTNPQNTASCMQFVEDTTTTTHGAYQIISGLTAGTIYTLSAWVKSDGTRNFASLRLTVSGGSPSYSAVWSLTDGTPGNTLTTGSPTSTSRSIVAYPNGWYRIQISMACPATFTSMLGYVNGSNTNTLTTQPQSYTGTANKGIYVWGAQFEAGSVASSYIPTGTSTVQRAADSCVMSGTNFSSWFNASQGTMLTTWSGTGVTSGRYATINDGSASNQIWTGFSESAIYNGSFQASFGSAGTANGKVALAYLFNDAAWCLNGGAVSTDTSVTLPTGLNQISIGNSQAGTAAIGTAVRTVKYFPTRLPDSTLRSLTL